MSKMTDEKATDIREIALVALSNPDIASKIGDELDLSDAYLEHLRDSLSDIPNDDIILELSLTEKLYGSRVLLSLRCRDRISCGREPYSPMP